MSRVIEDLKTQGLISTETTLQSELSVTLSGAATYSGKELLRFYYDS